MLKLAVHCHWKCCMTLKSIFTALIVLVFPVMAEAAPSAVRISIMGDASSDVGFAWSTYSGTAEAQIQYGTASGSLTQSKNGIVSKVSSTLGSVSEVTLTGLKPATTYYYKVGGTSGGWSKEFSFKTGPKPHKQCGKVNFVVFGDSRAESWQGDLGSSAMWGTLSANAAKLNPAFFLHGGDIVHDGGKQKQWYNHLQRTSAVSHKIPVLYAIGNHDDGPGEGDGANYNRIFNLPRASKTLGGSGTEDYFYFTAGPIIVVSLSTSSFKKGTIKYQNQADWLDKVLTANPKRWKFVVLHAPIYTEKGLFGHAPNEDGQNPAFVKVINKHHVDMVFQSHNHFYERWAPSKCSNPASTKVCPSGSYDTGTVYITTGGGGAFPIIVPGFTSKTRVKVSGEHHYIHVEINNQTLKLTTVNGAGKNLDTVTWSKKVTAPDPCLIPPIPDAGMSDMTPTADMSSTVDTGSATSDLPAGGDTSTPTGDTGLDDTGASADKGASQQDTGTTTPPSTEKEGCSCYVGGGPDASGLLLLLGLLVLCRRKR